MNQNTTYNLITFSCEYYSLFIFNNKVDMKKWIEKKIKEYPHHRHFTVALPIASSAFVHTIRIEVKKRK